jgi:hypothetical protein
MLPSILLIAAAGSVVSWRILRTVNCERAESLTGRAFMAELFKAAWPVILLVALVIGAWSILRVLAGAVLVCLQQRASRADIAKNEVRHGTSHHGLLFAVMLYKRSWRRPEPRTRSSMI